MNIEELKKRMGQAAEATDKTIATIDKIKTSMGLKSMSKDEAKKLLGIEETKKRNVDELKAQIERADKLLNNAKITIKKIKES